MPRSDLAQGLHAACIWAANMSTTHILTLWFALQEDMMADQDACGRGRLANVADTCKVGSLISPHLAISWASLILHLLLVVLMCASFAWQ